MIPAPRAHNRLVRTTAGVCLGLSLVACETTTTERPVQSPAAVLTAVPAVKGWVVVERGAPVGSVVSFRDPGAERVLYSVRNHWNQDLGVVDAMGRAWRRIPHRDDQLLGTGTVLDGARLILGLEGPAELEPVPLEALEGAPTPPPRDGDG